MHWHHTFEHTTCGLESLHTRDTCLPKYLLATAMQEAGYVEVATQPFLPDLTFLVSGRKP